MAGGFCVIERPLHKGILICQRVYQNPQQSSDSRRSSQHLLSLVPSPHRPRRTKMSIRAKDELGLLRSELSLSPNCFDFCSCVWARSDELLSVELTATCPAWNLDRWNEGATTLCEVAPIKIDPSGFVLLQFKRPNFVHLTTHQEERRR